MPGSAGCSTCPLILIRRVLTRRVDLMVQSDELARHPCPTVPRSGIQSRIMLFFTASKRPASASSSALVSMGRTGSRRECRRDSRLPCIRLQEFSKLLVRDPHRLFAKQTIGHFALGRCWYSGHQIAVQGVLAQVTQRPISVDSSTLGVTSALSVGKRCPGTYFQPGYNAPISLSTQPGIAGTKRRLAEKSSSFCLRLHG